jgi:hypothetical protein
MANKMASRISGGLLAAVALSLVLQTASFAERGFSAGGGNMSRSAYMGGVNRGGYPIGTMSSSQYGGSLQNRYSPAMQAGPWWWYGGGGLGATTYTGSTAGWGYGMGGMGMGYNPEELLYPTADGPQPTTTPVPTYQTEAMDNLATAHQVIHTDGPSMSFQDDMDMPKASSYFKGFWNDINEGQSVAAQQVASVPSVQPNSGTARNFDHPVVQSRLSTPVQFNSKVAVRSELKPQLQEAEQMFMDLKTSGKLGTFDIEPLESKLLDLRQRARQVDNIDNSVEQRAEEGRLINSIKQFEYELRQHIDP